MIINTNVSIISSSVQIADDNIRDQQAGPQEPIIDTDSTNIESEVVVDKPEAENKEKGVLRLLREGHFKGVSDIRLRINFHDEISAMEQEKSALVAEENVTKMIDSINNDMENFLQIADDSDQLPAIIENLTQNFNSAASLSLDKFLTAETPDKNSLTTQISVSFEELKSGLESAINETSERATVESTDDTIQNNTDVEMTAVFSPDDNNIEPRMDTTQTIFRQFLAQLIDTFTTGLNTLETALGNIKILPDISAPHGNGGAYDKFLEIYNQYGSETSPADGISADAQSRIDPPSIDTLT